VCLTLAQAQTNYDGAQFGHLNKEKADTWQNW